MGNRHMKPRTSWLAVASLVVAVPGFIFSIGACPYCCAETNLFVLGPLVMVIGFTAIVLKVRNPSKISGTPYAVMGVLFGLAIVANGAQHYRPPGARQRINCLNNMKQIGTALTMYGREHDGKLPAPDRWNEAVLTYVKNKQILYCPSVKDKNAVGYAMNVRLRGLYDKDIADPASTVMVFESRPGRDLCGGPELLPENPRHQRWFNVVFCDGRAEQVPESDIGTLVWEPKMKGREERVPH